MKFALPLFLLASPALAHTGAHLHPHGSENWIIGALLVGTCFTVLAAKRLKAARAEKRS
ncbi:hypothetical protein [Sulfitobacter donghicola]|uniref:Peptidase M23 n=1 Tax=Sulfitobacter donghicola DSW-25 = KCTC 12864 = JCM 14565 TaxID=1300350 RepID=A0A073III3_9RHOB|nr:hypothetical protein [Sulfitobacter donghicola]KEJ90138.1 hypothetical protein DSW25_08035 [Sulfitobacter donghicola DSW-25 = KCTC 12864 = JCM 14565]KIN66707.1 hypothetical protein Z948_408 [Sulfitobacter donghicola DSW-25 = KCTC 12864 = JCM 14565]